MTRRAELGINLALCCTSLAIAFTAVEAVARYRLGAWPFDTPIEYPGYLAPDERTLRWRFSSAEGRNSLGLRNREVAAKPPGTVRVLFLGDSMIWSGTTTSGELYTEVLERRLNGWQPGGAPRIEVINAGIPGYTTYQELEFLRLHGLDMDPDLVVLGFVFNDVFDPYLHRPTAANLLDVEPAAYLHQFDTRSPPGAWVARSYLAHLIVHTGRDLWDRITGRTGFPFERRRDFFLAWKPYGWDAVSGRLEQIDRLLAERGVPLHMVVFPVSDQVNPRYLERDERYVLYPQARIAAIARSLSIPTLDLTRPLLVHGGPSLYRDYLHLDARGNDVVADALATYLAPVLGLEPDPSAAGAVPLAD